MNLEKPWYSRSSVILSLLHGPVTLPVVLVIDLYHLGRGVARSLVANGRMAYSRLVVISHPQKYVLDQQVIMSDLRCVSWMLQTSLDRVVHLSTLEHLATMTTLTDFNTTIVVDCFNAFVGCTNINDYRVVVVRGLEQLAAVSALCFFNTISHLLVLDPTSSVLEDVRQRYAKVFPAQTRFHVHEFCHTLGIIHHLFTRYRNPHRRPQTFQWIAYQPPSHEHTIVAHNLLKFALLGYQRKQ